MGERATEQSAITERLLTQVLPQCNLRREKIAKLISVVGRRVAGWYLENAAGGGGRLWDAK